MEDYFALDGEWGEVISGYVGGDGNTVVLRLTDSSDATTALEKTLHDIPILEKSVYRARTNDFLAQDVSRIRDLPAAPTHVRICELHRPVLLPVKNVIENVSRRR